MMPFMLGALVLGALYLLGSICSSSARIQARVMAAIGSRDPTVIRAEAQALRAEGHTIEADYLDGWAAEAERRA